MRYLTDLKIANDAVRETSHTYSSNKTRKNVNKIESYQSLKHVQAKFMRRPTDRTKRGTVRTMSWDSRRKYHGLKSKFL